MDKNNKINIDYNKYIWEKWTVQDFIDDLHKIIYFQDFKNEEQLKKWCISNQPYYKKYIPEVFEHFKQIIKLKEII